MVGDVINCKKCHKIFQQRLHALCPVCLQEEDEQFTRLYRLLQESASRGGIGIDILSAKVGVSIEAIEKIYMEGKFSTAGLFLKMPCQVCGVMAGERERKGRFCHKCSEQTANKAGVEVKDIQAINREEALEEKRQQQHEAMIKRGLKPRTVDPDEPSRFGFSVRR